MAFTQNYLQAPSLLQTYDFDQFLQKLNDVEISAQDLSQLLDKAIQLDSPTVYEKGIVGDMESKGERKRYRNMRARQLETVIIPALLAKGANWKMVSLETVAEIKQRQESNDHLRKHIVTSCPKIRAHMKALRIFDRFLNGQPIPKVSPPETPPCIHSKPLQSTCEQVRQAKTLLPYFIELKSPDGSSEKAAEPYIQRAMMTLLKNDNTGALTFGTFHIDGQQETLLTYAVKKNLYTLVYLILQSGVNPNIMVNGKTPKDYATDPYMHELLAQSGGRPAFADRTSRSLCLDKVPLEQLAEHNVMAKHIEGSSSELTTREGTHCLIKMANERPDILIRVDSTSASTGHSLVERMIEEMNGTLGVGRTTQTLDHDQQRYHLLLSVLDQAQFDLSESNNPELHDMLTRQLNRYFQQVGRSTNITAELLRTLMVYGYTPPVDYVRQLERVMTADTRIPGDRRQQLCKLIQSVINIETNARDGMLQNSVDISSPSARAMLTLNPTDERVKSTPAKALKILLEDSGNHECAALYAGKSASDMVNPVTLTDVPGQLLQQKQIVIGIDDTGCADPMSQTVFGQLRQNQFGMTLYRNPKNRQKVRQVLGESHPHYNNFIKDARRNAFLSRILMDIDPDKVNKVRTDQSLDQLVKRVGRVGEMTLKPIS
ncbi:hypothetical protein [Endozoicomonas atrinae]|uniref:hypothetical protein n=1 Tax=Endozoicomonas atrinae TaxID=1333660 RepID=UPI001112F7EA|nr:hypothetical protein [Endozoicomonas atrinae]